MVLCLSTVWTPEALEFLNITWLLSDHDYTSKTARLLLDLLLLILFYAALCSYKVLHFLCYFTGTFQSSSFSVRNGLHVMSWVYDLCYHGNCQSFKCFSLGIESNEASPIIKKSSRNTKGQNGRVVSSL